VDPWPDVPTSKKLGYTLKWGPAVIITAPKGLPNLILNKLLAVFSEAMMSPQYQKMARDQQILHTTPFSGSDLNNFLQEQFNIYGAMIKELGLQKK
jgi:tripartite-type tricarboxylate transporter receptor subunit TctC